MTTKNPCVEKRKHGQTWHHVIDKAIREELVGVAIENRIEVNPKDLAKQIGITHQRATSILASLGGDRISGLSNSDPIMFSFAGNNGIPKPNPCIECEDYTYYGCRRSEECGKKTIWKNMK